MYGRATIVVMFARKGRYAAAYTHRSPSRDEELKVLLRWITEQPGAGLVFVGPQARSLENSAVASALVKTRRASYTTWKNKDWWNHGHVIALWPNDKALQALDDVSTIEALGVLTWNLNDVKAWATGVGAIDVLDPSDPTETPTISDVVTLGALRSLTNSVNLSSGLSHPSDWDNAVRTFRALRKRGHAIDPDVIEAWAVANGWSYRHASDVAQLARELVAGKAKRTKSPGGNWTVKAELVEHWRDLGEEADWSPA